MQDAGVDEHDAEPAEASWYLSRDGQQHGPLSDRELSLFAEGGNFKPGDLLWTAGLDEWKPADSIFGLAAPDDAETPAPESASGDADLLPDAEDDLAFEDGLAAPAQDEPAASSRSLSADAQGRQAGAFADDPLFDDGLGDEPLDDHVGALAKALSGEAEPPKLSFREQLTADIKAFGGFCLYLWAVFILLTVHAVVGAAQVGVGLSFFLLTTVNAFLLMRALPFAESLGFYRALQYKPLIYSIIAKTLLFVTGLILAYAIEMGLLAFMGMGGGFFSLGGGVGGMLAWWLIFSLALFPYFVFREVEGTVGADMMGKLLFGRM